MPRHFTSASNELITTGIGSLSFAFGPGTIAAVVRIVSFTASNTVIDVGNSSTVRYIFYIETTGARLRLNCDAGASTGVTALTANKWYLVAASKATGTVAPRFHIYDYATGGWVHENASGTLANSTAPTTKATIGNSLDATIPTNGDIEIVGVWSSVLSDTQIETLPFRVKPWFAAAQPSGLWTFDQALVSVPIVDYAGLRANQTGITGTTQATGPFPNWNFGFDMGPEHSIAGG